MPELPEVETIVRQLDKVLKSKVIEKVEVFKDKSFEGKKKLLVGKRIKRVGRKAKVIIVEFFDWNKMVVIHLKMTGQLVFDEKKGFWTSQNDGMGDRVVGGHPTADWVNKLPSKHTRVMINFKDGSRLFFNDMRVFGWMRIQEISNFITPKDGQELQISSWPPDVVDREFDFNYLKSVLRGSKRAIKLVILDQKKMGGIGNIYANDALFLAGIDPKKIAGELDKKEIEKLWKAIVKVINKGIEMGGASYSDYKDTKGLGGKYQDEFLVYSRESKKCKKCGGEIKKFKLGGRGTYWCPGCQMI